MAWVVRVADARLVGSARVRNGPRDGVQNPDGDGPWEAGAELLDHGEDYLPAERVADESVGEDAEVAEEVEDIRRCCVDG